MRRLKFRDQKGQATLEFSFAMIFFAALLFTLADITRICFGWVNLQFAVNEAARFTSTGKVDPGDVQREDSIRDRIQSVVPNAVVSFLDENGDPMAMAGGPRAFVRLVAQDEVGLSPVSDWIGHVMGNPGNTYPLRAETVIRNEPFN